jgi:hypothetical protein
METNNLNSPDALWNCMTFCFEIGGLGIALLQYTNGIPYMAPLVAKS